MPPPGVGEREYQHNVLLAILVLGHVSVSSSSQLNGCDGRGARDSRCNDIFPVSDRTARYFLAWMASLQISKGWNRRSNSNQYSHQRSFGSHTWNEKRNDCLWAPISAKSVSADTEPQRSVTLGTLSLQPAQVSLPPKQRVFKTTYKQNN